MTGAQDIGAKEIVARVDGALLMRHCEEFARRVKLSGTPEERESFLYLQKCLETYGFRTAVLVPTFHPAFLLRNPGQEFKRMAWDDLKLARREYERLTGAGSRAGLLVTDSAPSPLA